MNTYRISKTVFPVHDSGGGKHFATVKTDSTGRYPLNNRQNNIKIHRSVWAAAARGGGGKVDRDGGNSAGQRARGNYKRKKRACTHSSVYKSEYVLLYRRVAGTLKLFLSVRPGGGYFTRRRACTVLTARPNSTIVGNDLSARRTRITVGAQTVRPVNGTENCREREKKEKKKEEKRIDIGN